MAADAQVRQVLNLLTLKKLSTYGCILNTVAPDALVLKHQAIIIHCGDYIFVLLDKFLTKMFHLKWTF